MVAASQRMTLSGVHRPVRVDRRSTTKSRLEKGHSAARADGRRGSRVLMSSRLLPLMLSRALTVAAPTVAKGLNGIVADTTRISSVGGNHDGLTYRGYPVEQLCKRRFEDTAHLLLHGTLPVTKDESDRYVARLAANRRVWKPACLIHHTARPVRSSPASPSRRVMNKLPLWSLRRAELSQKSSAGLWSSFPRRGHALPPRPGLAPAALAAPAALCGLGAPLAPISAAPCESAPLGHPPHCRCRRHHRPPAALPPHPLHQSA